MAHGIPETVPHLSLHREETLASGKKLVWLLICSNDQAVYKYHSLPPPLRGQSLKDGGKLKRL